MALFVSQRSNSIVGLKPTYERCPAGLMAIFLDQIFVLVKTVDAEIFHAIEGFDPWKLQSQ